MSFLSLISNKELRIAVVGLGYVGLPMAVTIAKKGYKVLGLEVSKHAIENVNSGKNYIGDVDDNDLKQLVKNGLLSATDDYSRIKDMDVILIAVPTPLDKYHQPDVSFIVNVTNSIKDHVKDQTLIVLESTTYPGTTREIIVPPIEKMGLVIGENIYIAFSPERVDPGNETYKTHNTPKVVGGITPKCNEIAKAFYESVLDAPVYMVSSPEVAEMEKIYENTFRNINIALANETTILCERMGINVWEVINAAKTKPYGFMAFYPGPGVGGHCIPIDPFYLTWKAREYNYHTRLIELAGEINIAMPEYVITRASKIANLKKKALSSCKVLIVGCSYKKDIRDMRESPVQNLIIGLEDSNTSFDIFDLYVDKFHNELNNKVCIPLKKVNYKNYDLIIIATDHSNINYKELVNSGVDILDTRNACKGINASNLFIL
jgi:UDP-N-acetyl-D-glucosamine dehydrogenase